MKYYRCDCCGKIFKDDSDKEPYILIAYGESAARKYYICDDCLNAVKDIISFYPKHMDETENYYL